MAAEVAEVAELPPFYKLWENSVVRAQDPRVYVGGNMQGISNLSCIRISNALIQATGAPLDVISEYKDKDGNGYIVRCADMVRYLTEVFGPPITLTKERARIMKGIIYFDSTGYKFLEQVGHFDLWDGNSLAASMTNYFDSCENAYLWPCYQFTYILF
eukprot:TRINITY_DN1250_c0_g1_i3.p2 TRINITY_DN1250_c0_g1~~TRINITY_DN1250_c0_g1_i3.p2  ORF type:complete len:158 (+),score=46.80 TRINITY_DN1250_c0_g1_i3:425-898(+)